MNKIIIIGIGNLLLRDEGVGVHVIKNMQGITLPENVELIDAGTSSLDVLSFIKEAKKVIFIDAVKGKQKPGTIYCFKPENVEVENTAHALSLHQLTLYHTLEWGKKLNINPDITIIGIEPKDMEYGLELSPLLARKIPKIIKQVLKQVESRE